MKRGLVYGLLLLGGFSCAPKSQIFVNDTMIPSKDIEFSIEVTKKELKQIRSRYLRLDNSYVAAEYKDFGIFTVWLNYDQVIATRKGRGRYHVLPKKYDERIKKAIEEQIK